MIFLFLTATPTPSPEKLSIWALQVARHTDLVTTDAYRWAIGAFIVAAIALGFSISDNIINRRQLRELLRKPDLYVDRIWPTAAAQKCTADGGATTALMYSGGLQCSIRNRGQRTSAEFQLEIWIPQRLWNPNHAAKDEATIKSIKCFRFVAIGGKIYPRVNDFRVGFSNDFWLISESESVEFFWRLNDDFAQYPVAGAYGKGSIILATS